MPGLHIVTLISHDWCRQAQLNGSNRNMQSSQPVNLGDLLQQLRHACGAAQQSNVVIGGPQTVSLAGVSDKVNVSGSASYV